MFVVVFPLSLGFSVQEGVDVKGQWLLLLWVATGSASLTWMLAWLLPRQPYRVMNTTKRQVDPELAKAFIEGKRHRRVLRRRVRSKIRAGTELQQECERRADSNSAPYASAVTPSTSLFGIGGLGGRVETWTKDAEKLLEGVSDQYLERFHAACLVSPPGLVTDESRYAATMGKRVQALQEIVADMEDRDSP